MATKSKSTKKGINSNRKGKAFERKVANLFKKHWNVEAYRTPGSGAFATTHNSRKLEDTVAADVVVEGLPLVIECKDYKTIGCFNWFKKDAHNRNIEYWWKKVEREASKVKKVPLLICKSDRTPIVVIMNWVIYNGLTEHMGYPDKMINFYARGTVGVTTDSLFCMHIQEILDLDKETLVVLLNEITRKLYGEKN
jgi:hypothetical protein